MGGVASMDLRSIAQALGGEVSNGQVLAPAPNHSPKDRGLSVRIESSAPDGFIVHLFNGGDPIEARDYVRQRCGAEPFKPNSKGTSRRHTAAPATSKTSDADRQAAKARLKKALDAHEAKTTNTAKEPIAVYPYTDENGGLLYEVLRFEPKDFRQRAACGSWNLAGVRRVLFRLTDLSANPSATVFITEGEKDGLRLVDLNLCATCISGGTKWTADVIEPLRGRDVIILPDADATGARKAWEAATALHGIAASVRMVTLPGLSGQPGDKDVSDWLDADPSRADTLVDICLAAPVWTPQPAPATAPDEIIRRAASLPRHD